MQESTLHPCGHWHRWEDRSHVSNGGKNKNSQNIRGRTKLKLLDPRMIFKKERKQFYRLLTSRNPLANVQTHNCGIWAWQKQADIYHISSIITSIQWGDLANCPIILLNDLFMQQWTPLDSAIKRLDRLVWRWPIPSQFPFG